MSVLLMVSALAGLGIALFNGANDNGKPVATLIGSGILSLRRGLLWGNIATLLGAVAAIVWGSMLLKAFSGHGLLEGAITGQTAFLPAVGLGAAITVALATRFSLPVSTTHALLGGLVGAGWGLGGKVAWGMVAAKLAGPLLLSPLAAIALTLVIVYPVRLLAGQASTRRCLCVSAGDLEVGTDGSLVMSSGISVQTGTIQECQPKGAWMMWPSPAQGMRWVHTFSALTVAFARGLNDTPKLAAMLLPLTFLGAGASIGVSAFAMGLGGWLFARGVARTMSQEITPLEDREADALAGNLSTAFLILLASRWGLPVSTTHVATGALVGAGASRGTFNWRVLGTILIAWVTTLPLAAALSGALVTLLGHL